MKRRYFIYTRKTKNQISVFFCSKKKCAKQRKMLNGTNSQYAVGSVVLRDNFGIVQLKPMNANINVEVLKC